MHWIFAGSLVRVSASERSARAFQGTRLSAATKPRRTSAGARTTRPEPTRVLWHTTTPCSCARVSAGAHDPFRPRRDRGVDHRSIRTHVGDDHIDPRQRLQSTHVELRLERVASRGAVVENHASVGVGVAEGTEVAALERLQAIGRRLLDIAPAMDRVVEHDEDAASARRGIGRDANRVEEVERPVRG